MQSILSCVETTGLAPVDLGLAHPVFRGGLANARLTASRRRARFGVLTVFAVFRSAHASGLRLNEDTILCQFLTSPERRKSLRFLHYL